MAEDWKQWEGRTIDDQFCLRKYLGDSEQSAVFLAEQSQTSQQFAIKLVIADGVATEYQLLQWRLAKRLSHPHLIRLLGTGRCRLDSTELVFAVMEYAEENLAQVLPIRPLTPAEALEMLAQTLDALAYLHNQGFVYGRLKPVNIMAIKDQIKLASDKLSGINSFRKQETDFDRGESNIYNAPEKSRGEVSSAADVWSLGVMLVEVLTQRLPSWNEKEQADPVLPQNLPAPFAEIVSGCLRRNPEERWTIADIATRLSLTLPASQKRKTIGSAAVFNKRRFAVRAGIAILVIAAIFVGARLFLRQSDAPENISAVTPSGQPNLGSLGPSHTASASNVKPSPASRRSGVQTVATNRGPVADDVVHQVLPDVPLKAMNTIHGTLRVGVKVQVDASGNVVGADLETPGPSQYFARLALQAAKSWTFAPGRQDLEREFVIHFDFTNTETRAFATRAAR